MSSAALLAFALTMFLGGAIIGIAMVPRLGSAGWFMYLFVMSTYALVFGPVLASAVTLHQRGSRKHRELIEQRIKEQREFFGLHARTMATQREDDPTDRPPM